MGAWRISTSIVGLKNSISPTIRTLVPFFEQYLSSPQIFFIRDYKTAGRLRLRCRDCFFERRDNRLYVECKTYARHRQAQIMSEPRTPWGFRRKIWKHVKWC
ncbi:39S ribosomal protein L36 mitochondrial [Taenia solium]|eukprot:TsM_000303200 transcript=TsM_000303200 gene=TsM_000303200